MWSVIFVMPNINIREAVGNEHISIVPFDDHRVSECTSASPFCKALIENFEDEFGRQVYPSALIINDDAPASVRHIEAIVGFRNALALSAIIRGHEHRLTSTFVAYPLYSDYFDFYPMTVSRDDDGYIRKSPSMLGWEDEYSDFKGQTSPGLGSMDMRPRANDPILELILKAWKRRYIKPRKNEWATRSLFRSLEMAYQATSMPFRNHSSIYDYGSSASLWVSALEVLSHPRKGKADLKSVLNMLNGYEWHRSTLGRKAYRIKYRGARHSVNLVLKLYKELYDTRNHFLHGDPVRRSSLYPFRNKRTQPLTRFAPLIYKVALMSVLDKYKQTKGRMQKLGWYMSQSMEELELSEAIMKCKGP